jgi:hypothetical protein
LLLLPCAGARAVADEATEIAKLRLERMAIEENVQQLRRRLPPEAEARNARTLLKRAAETAVAGFEVTLAPAGEVVSLDDGRPSTLRALRLEVTGRGALYDLAIFFTRVGVLDYWLRDLESFEAEGDGGEQLAFRARFVYLVEAAPEPDPEPPRSGTAEVLLALERRALEHERSRLRLLEAWSARTDDGRIAVAKTLLEAYDGASAARFTRIAVGEEIALEGVTVGAAARAGLLERLAGAGFAATRFETPPAGACRPFALAATLGAGGPAPAAVDGPGPGRAAALCAAAEAPPRGRIEAHGAANGTLSLRLRGVDVAQVSFVLHDLTGEGFIVDGDVAGRVDVEVAAATLEETLAALGGTGLAVGPPPLRRISRAPAAPLADEFTGEPVSLSFQGAALADVLCLFEEITGLGFRVPAGLDARATIHVRELPWDHALEALIASAGLARQLDGTTVYVGPLAEVASGRRSLWGSACAARAPAQSPLAGIRPPLAELGATDLELAGLASGAGGHQAYAYGAGRELLRLAPGDRLFDALVSSVGPDGVRLARFGGGELRLALER